MKPKSPNDFFRTKSSMSQFQMNSMNHNDIIYLYINAEREFEYDLKLSNLK